jgi:hypothetical protein
MVDVITSSCSWNLQAEIGWHPVAVPHIRGHLLIVQDSFQYRYNNVPLIGALGCRELVTAASLTAKLPILRPDNAELSRLTARLRHPWSRPEGPSFSFS